MIVVVTIIRIDNDGFWLYADILVYACCWVGFLICDSMFFLFCVVYVLCSIMYGFRECWERLCKSCLSVELESFLFAGWKRGGRFQWPGIWKKWEYPSRQGRY